MRRRAIGWLLGALLTALLSGAVAQDLRPFDAQSLGEIKKALQGRPFVLAFWSLHCEPCREDMPHWRALRAAHPSLSVILVAADDPSEQEMVRDYLARFDLSGVQTWAFKDEFAERLRYAVDPKWRGELPRTYFYDATHRSAGRSGRISPAQWDRWLADLHQ